MVLRNQDDFIKWFTEENEDFFKDCSDKSSYLLPEESHSLNIENISIDEVDVRNKSLWGTTLKDVTFSNCDFNSVIIHNCVLENCRFENCQFYRVKFIESDLRKNRFISCSIIDTEIVDSFQIQSVFKNCYDITDFKIAGYADREMKFQNCKIHLLLLENQKDGYNEIQYFRNCIISNSFFDRSDLTHSRIENCSLSLNSFSACRFSNNTFYNNSAPGDEYNMIDIRSILNSPPFRSDVLNDIFGIKNDQIKEYLEDLTTEIKFQSIFISYSFQDSKFAKFLSETLTRKGVLNFLWENDAPGGKQLKEIMAESIREKDRILFISSKSSLKSPACHYELTQGRKKQEITWEDVLFPIHIDNSLFELNKEQIRPISKQEEYWSNIEELKNLHSLDFSRYQNNFQVNQEFEKLIFKLIKGLRK